MSSHRVCFDVETEPFSDDFRNAKTLRARLKTVPRMRVACVFSERDRKYRYFTPHRADELIEVLRRAEEVITFNGKAFDILVLRRHYGLKGKLPRHVDIHTLLTDRAGFRVSLDLAAKLNLGESKHTKGREMNSLDAAALRNACKSDVQQTYRLWRLYTAGTLQIPSKRSFGGGDWRGGPGSFMPDLCPSCHDVGSLLFIDWDDEDALTDGQFAEYMAGTQGSAVCATCNCVFNWNV